MTNMTQTNEGGGEGMRRSESVKRELAALKLKYAELQKEARDARTVIMLYRRWQHASDVEAITGDEADTGTMLIEASFAAQDFVDKYENQIKPMQVRRGQGGDE